MVKVYGVLIRRGDGTAFLASGGNSLPFMNRKHGRALEYIKELTEHGFKRERLRVIKLEIRYRTAQMTNDVK
jgi:hypothetical protein